jgi:general secretion pathway protein D
VLADDGQIIVLGGLIEDTEGDGRQVRGLGDIPVLGNLFKYQHPHPQEDQPDGVPAPGGGPQQGAEQQPGDRPLRLHAQPGRARSSRRMTISWSWSQDLGQPMLPPLQPRRRRPRCGGPWPAGAAGGPTADRVRKRAWRRPAGAAAPPGTVKPQV